jgi:hypothetical protein
LLGSGCSGWSWIRRCGARARGGPGFAGARVELDSLGVGVLGLEPLGGAAMLGVTKAREGRVAPQVREVRRRWPRVTTADDRRRALGTGFRGMKGTKEEIMF